MREDIGGLFMCAGIMNISAPCYQTVQDTNTNESPQFWQLYPSVGRWLVNNILTDLTV